MFSVDTKAAFPADPLLSLFGMLLAFSIQQQLCKTGQTLQVVCQSFPEAFHLLFSHEVPKHKSSLLVFGTH